MKTHKASRSLFKPSNLFIPFALLFALSVNANEVSVLGKPLPVYTQDADKPHLPAVIVKPQVANPDLPVQIKTQPMAVGDKIYLLGKGSALSNYNVIQMLGMQIICRGATHTEIVGDLYSTRNHLGKDVETDGVLSLVVRYLFIAPYADTYTCSLRAQNFTGRGAKAGTHYWTLQAGSTNTNLSVDPTVPGSISWGTEHDPKDDKRATTPPNVPLAGTTYSGTNAHIAKTDALFGDAIEYALRSPQWIPAEKSNVRVISDIEVTVCYFGTDSCPDYAKGEDFQKSLGSTIKTRLTVQQFYADGTVCKATQTDYVPRTITSDTHHQKIFHNNEVVVAECGANSYFTSRVEVYWLSGNPVRIEDSEYSHGAFINVPAS